MSCAGGFAKLGSLIQKVGALLDELPSNGWQALDDAETAALVTFYSDQEIEDREKMGLPFTRPLLEQIAEDLSLISETISVAETLSKGNADGYADALPKADRPEPGSQPFGSARGADERTAGSGAALCRAERPKLGAKLPLRPRRYGDYVNRVIQA